MLHTPSPTRRRVAVLAATLLLPFALSGCAVIGVASAATSVATTGASLALSGASLALSGASLAVDAGVGVARLTTGAAGLARDMAAAKDQGTLQGAAESASVVASAPPAALTLTPELTPESARALSPPSTAAPTVDPATVTAVD